MRNLTGVSLGTLTSDDAQQSFEALTNLYRTVYAEAPYYEGETDVADFASSLEARRNQPSFRIVVANDDEETIGFALGHSLKPGTRWWSGALTPLPEHVVHEYPRRTFAVIELAVEHRHRRRGVGRALHDELTRDLEAERLTLLVRPDAVPARNAYMSWGYDQVGQIQPFADGPVYDAMVRPLQPSR